MDEKDKFYGFEGGINIDADDTISSVFDVSMYLYHMKRPYGN